MSMVVKQQNSVDINHFLISILVKTMLLEEPQVTDSWTQKQLHPNGHRV